MPEGPQRLLLAEDEALIALTMEDVLVEAGYQVVVVPDGAQALKAAVATRFDALITDLRMPELSGEELIARLRAMRPDLPVVVITGSAPAAGAQALQRLGEAPVALLHKPLVGDELVQAVDAALAFGKPRTI